MIINILLGLVLTGVGLVTYLIWDDLNAAEQEYYKRMKRLSQRKR